MTGEWIQIVRTLGADVHLCGAFVLYCGSALRHSNDLSLLHAHVVLISRSLFLRLSTYVGVCQTSESFMTAGCDLVPPQKLSITVSPPALRGLRRNLTRGCDLSGFRTVLPAEEK